MPEAQKTGEYEIILEGSEEVLRIDANKWSHSPSVEDHPLVMASTIDKLVEVPTVSRLFFHQRRYYSYNSEQTQYLVEIAKIYDHLVRGKKLFTLGALGFDESYVGFIQEKNSLFEYLVFDLLRHDPLGCYIEVQRLLREEKIVIERETVQPLLHLRKRYAGLLEYFFTLLDSTQMVAVVRSQLAGYKIGDRSFYRQLFRPLMTPDFMYTQVMAQPPLNGEQVDVYSNGKSEITVFRIPGDIKLLYHLYPPEFKLTEDEYTLLELARNVLAEHKPRQEEFLDPQRMRKTFFNIGRDLLQELVEHKQISLDYKQIALLADILVRYTVGFGILEILLQDEKVQDIMVNGPIGQTPIFLVHQDYGECVTNIIPSREDSDSWATKLRLLSGRPLDEANPVLDTDLSIPGARSRVSVITTPLSPVGLSFAFRRHRDKPWTLPLFIQQKMLTPLAAAVLSFAIDGGRTLLFAGTRGSGKTSLLGASLVEIMRTHRIISIEDSVTGDSEILIKKANCIQKTTIGKLIDSSIQKYGSWYNLSGHEVLGNRESIQVLSLNKDNKLTWSHPSKLIRHKVQKQIYQIKTRTGRIIKTTADHSLFTLGDEGTLQEIKPVNLSIGSHIATIRKIPFNDYAQNTINLLDYLDRIPRGILQGESLKKFIKKYYSEIKQLAKEQGYTRSIPPRWLRLGQLPIVILKNLNIDFTPFKEKLSYKYSGNSQPIPTDIRLDSEFLMLVGLWLADGCYDERSIIVSSFDEEDSNIVCLAAKQFKLTPKIHSDGGSLMINSTTLRFIFRDILELRGDAYTKKVPSWIYSLSKQQIAFVLQGVFSGDGCVSDNEIVIPLASYQLLRDLQTLLLGYDITLRIGKKRKDGTFNAGISTLRDFIEFKKNIGVLQSYKLNCLDKLCLKRSTHDTTDIIPLSLQLKKEISNLTKDNKIFNTQDYISRNNNVGRRKFLTLMTQVQITTNITQNLQKLVHADIFWDEVAEIEPLSSTELYVYDLSVPDYENFVCNNILLHNTLELPIDALRNMCYNIQPMKVRAALMSGGNELAADEGIRTSLRMGDSSLIVGEIRSLEAKALFEAMRIGALANVVAGTIHGAHPYAVYDRIVNDLGVPKTSFKAVDLIIVSNPVRSADGLHSKRRVLQITEVRKHWDDDPQKQGGFVDLFRYDSKQDALLPTDDLLQGNSEVLKSIAANVREWAGNWDAVWDGVLVRAQVKETLLKAAQAYALPELLEAPFVVQSNDYFHQSADKINEQHHVYDNKRIFADWEAWLRQEVKRRKFPSS